MNDAKKKSYCSISASQINEQQIQFQIPLKKQKKKRIDPISDIFHSSLSAHSTGKADFCSSNGETSSRQIQWTVRTSGT